MKYLVKKYWTKAKKPLIYEVEEDKKYKKWDIYYIWFDLYEIVKVIKWPKLKKF